MEPKYSLVHLTGISTPPPEFIRIAAAAGYDCVSLRTISMGMPGEVPHDLTRPELLRETRRALEETGIIFNDTENTRIVEGTDVKDYEPHLAAAAELGVRHILGNIWTPDRSYYTDQFGKLCELAAQYGLDINIEFVTWASVTNLRQTVELLKAVNMPNAGIMIDALHFYRSRVQLRTGRAAPGMVPVHAPVRLRGGNPHRAGEARPHRQSGAAVPRRGVHRSQIPCPKAAR